MQKPSVKDYSIRVQWSPLDKLYLARVDAFPSLCVHGETAALAVEEMQGLLEVVLLDLASTDSPIPQNK